MEKVSARERIAAEDLGRGGGIGEGGGRQSRGVALEGVVGASDHDGGGSGVVWVGGERGVTPVGRIALIAYVIVGLTVPCCSYRPSVAME